MEKKLFDKNEREEREKSSFTIDKLKEKQNLSNDKNSSLDNLNWEEND